MSLNKHNVSIRDWRRDDRQALVEALSNRNVWQTYALWVPTAYTVADAEQWLDSLSQDATGASWAIDLAGHAVGNVAVYRVEAAPLGDFELGYWLAEPYWGRGIMSAVIPHVLTCLSQSWAIKHVFSKVLASNYASIRILQKSGFQLMNQGKTDELGRLDFFTMPTTDLN